MVNGVTTVSCYRFTPTNRITPQQHRHLQLTAVVVAAAAVDTAAVAKLSARLLSLKEGKT